MKKEIVLLCILVSCSHSKQPLSYEDASKREAQELVVQDFTSADHLLAFQVKGKSMPKAQLVQEQIPYYYVTIDIGSAVPIECYLYMNDIAPGTALKTLTDKILASNNIGKMVEKKTSMFGAGAVGGNPYLLLQTAFTAEKDGKISTGNVKSMSGIKEVGSVVCAHNEVGYQKTFAERFSEILTSFKFAQAPMPDIMYKSIMLLSIKEIPVGFIADYVGHGQMKTKTWVQKSSLFMPSSETEVYSLDDIDAEISSHEGVVLYGMYRSQNNSVLSHLLEIKTEDSKNYSVKGTVGEKKVDSHMKTSSGIVSIFKHTNLLGQKFFKQKIQSFSSSLYVPSTNPYAPTLVRVTLKKANDEGAIVKINDGAGSYFAVVEADGTFEAVTYPVQNTKIEGKRIFRVGRLRQD